MEVTTTQLHEKFNIAEMANKIDTIFTNDELDDSKDIILEVIVSWEIKENKYATILKMFDWNIPNSLDEQIQKAKELMRAISIELDSLYLMQKCLYADTMLNVYERMESGDIVISLSVVQ